MDQTDFTPTVAAEASARAIHDLGATFMLDSHTYSMAAAAGYRGTSFYYSGRGGVLGDVNADRVAEAFLFFPFETVELNWTSSASVETRRDSAERFARSAHEWATSHLAEGALDYARLAELAGKVIDAADGADAPVFAGWCRLAEPSGDRELAVHRINALRELRAARHGDAVKAVDLEPVDAFMIKTPYMAGIFGWPEPETEPDEDAKAKWERAEQLTNEAFGRDLSVLDTAELAEFCELVNTAWQAAS